MNFGVPKHRLESRLVAETLLNELWFGNTFGCRNLRVPKGRLETLLVAERAPQMNVGFPKDCLETLLVAETLPN